MGRPKGEPIDFPCFDEPTRTERPLVAAIKADRENWPAIYSEMCKVDKDMLLEDPDYCNRHRNPSLTQFYIECGAMASMRISMLRKFDRAGKFYEKCLSRFPDLPPISDPSIAKLSPDTLILICRIEEFINMGAPDNSLDVEWLVHRLVSDVVEGHGLARKQLNAWLAGLQDAERYGRLDFAVADFASSLDPRRLTSSRLVFGEAQRSQPLESFAKRELADAGWLDAAYVAAGGFPGGDAVAAFPRAVEVVPGPLVPGSSVLAHGFAVVDARRRALAVHVVDVCPPVGSDDGGEATALAGADYRWVLADPGDGDAPDLRLGDGLGLLVRDGGELRVARPAARRDPDGDARLALMSALVERMARSLGGKPYDKRAYAELPDAGL